jgi:cytochrome c-type biogenesis protein CcsB
MELALLRLAVGSYLAATVAALAGVAVRREVPGVLVGRFLLAGFAVQAVSMAVGAVSASRLSVTTFDEALSFLAMLLVAIFLLAQLWRPLLALGAVVSPLAFGLTVAAAAVYQPARPVPLILDSRWLPVHVALSFLGDAVFALAFSASLLYLLQERRLKARRRGRIPDLPSLETLDRLNYTCLKWGLGLLTLGIVTGIVWAHTAWQDWSWSDPKLVFSLVTWGNYVVLLLGRMAVGWRGRRAATLTIAGFAVIVLSLVGVNVFALGSHGKAF